MATQWLLAAIHRRPRSPQLRATRPFRGVVPLARVVVLSALLFATGCQLTPNFRTGYQVATWPDARQPAGALAVQDFAEERPDRLYSSAGRTFLTYVPLLPWVSMPFERIDESVRLQSDQIARRGRGITRGAEQHVAPPFEEYTYPASFARAVAEDLARSGLFSRVDPIGTEAPSDDHAFVLSGRLRASPLRRTVTSYGLGMPGVLLWFLPIPMSKTTGGTTLELELRDTRTSEVVWSQALEHEVQRYFILYTSSAMIYGRGGAFSFNLEPAPDNAVDRRSLFGWHFAALRRAMLDARPGLIDAVTAHRQASATP